MFQGSAITAGNARLWADAKDEVMYKTMVADSFYGIAQGLDAMATGMRATYILLEEVKRFLLVSQQGGR